MKETGGKAKENLGGIRCKVEEESWCWGWEKKVRTGMRRGKTLKRGGKKNETRIKRMRIETEIRVERAWEARKGCMRGWVERSIKTVERRIENQEARGKAKSKGTLKWMKTVWDRPRSSRRYRSWRGYWNSQSNWKRWVHESRHVASSRRGQKARLS